ncbi:uncharacterized protein KY384_002637 [Bacidia gigantensis]|uniref:uncharacterized protein n=1 Tax=Bacidia gigantensis TaxID=2732470 RepID=UPI001D037342|nr:uncharacterized protein KY384_002637 [Bacidia gigantensis]KAG8532759.1 hypothetical protein KY384_002637 [Bacidia gigantensis]
MRTDWHRYNLKRRVASLPPISAEIFQEKVLTAQASSTAVAAKASFEKPCSACQKIYYSENAYQNHLRGQRHRSRVTALSKDDSTTEDGSVATSTFSLGEPINNTPDAVTRPVAPRSPRIGPEAEEEFSKVVDSLKDTRITDGLSSPVSRRPTRPRHSALEDRTEHPLSPEKSGVDTEEAKVDMATTTNDIHLDECLFCNLRAADIQQNVLHMFKVHGLFVPERDYLVDLEGLLRWLWTQIHAEPHECLYCHKIRHSAEAMQAHMRDAGHCKIAFEEEEDMIQIGQFYDFTSTYSDDEDIEMDGNDQNSDGKGGEGDWEDESDVGSEDADDKLEVDDKQEPKENHARNGTGASHPILVLDDELHLPSGKVAGHRSLAKYFRQNLRDRPSPGQLHEQQKLLDAAVDEEQEDVAMTNGGHDARNGENGNRGRQLISRANGGQGLIGVSDAKKQDIQAVEKKDARRAQRAEKQYQWGVNKRANNQKHFRDPLLQ